MPSRTHSLTSVIDLIVAAAARVQLAAQVAELFDQGPFDMRVNVFELDGEFEFAAFDLGRRWRRGPGRFVSASSVVRMPTSASIRAWAWLAMMSCR